MEKERGKTTKKRKKMKRVLTQKLKKENKTSHPGHPDPLAQLLVRRLVAVRGAEGVEVDQIGRARRLAPAQDNPDDERRGDDGDQQRRGVGLDLGLLELARELGERAVLLRLLEARGGEGQGRDADERDEVVDDAGEDRPGDLAPQRGGHVC